MIRVRILWDVSSAIMGGFVRGRRRERGNETTPDGIILICEDDGVGIASGKKEVIFDWVFGEGKFDLFFVREFLSLSGMTITETGEPGESALFEITVPNRAWRRVE